MLRPFDFTAVAWSDGKIGPVNGLTTIVVAVANLTNRPKSVRNRCVIKHFGGVFCAVTLLFLSNFSVGVGG